MKNRIALLAMSLLLLFGLQTPASAAYSDAVCGGSTVLNKKVHEFTHNGNTVAIAFCLLQTTEATLTYDYARLKFRDDLLPDQNHDLYRIEVDLLTVVNNNNGTEAVCDQDNNWQNPPYVDRNGNEYGASADGRGCNNGNYSAGSGPCVGLHAVDSVNPNWPHPKNGEDHYGYSPVAYGSNGCKLLDGNGFYHTTTYAQTDKVNVNLIDTIGCHAEVSYRVKFANGDVSNWQSPTLPVTNCH
jgi:hypothetical protein